MSSILILVSGFLPSFVWLVFFLREDTHPEPKRLLAAVFFSGALSAFLAYEFQKSIEGWPMHPTLFWGLAALSEEIVKFLAAYAVVSRNAELDEPIDAMIYMITAALGFALIENVGFLYNVIHAAQKAGLPPTGAIDKALSVLTLRFVGATLLHALASAIAGYYWAKSMFTTRIKEKVFMIGAGLLIASTLHAIFNSIILNTTSASANLLSYLLIFIVAVGVIVLFDFEKIKRNRN